MSVWQAVLFLTLCCYLHQETDAKSAGGQCGAAFVKALYRACAVAKRAFHPVELEEQKRLQSPSKFFKMRSNGGKFGTSGGGGMFKKAENSQANERYAGEVTREQMDEVENPSNQYDPWSKTNSGAALKAYVEQLKREGDFERATEFEAREDRSDTSDMETRGYTASNLLVEHCCKHGCDWQTFVNLCK